jgi:aflatoxin B1 aldehyde reductase
MAATQQQLPEVKMVVGTNNFGGRMDLPQVKRALAMLAVEGVTELDLARAYNGGATEVALGAALAGAPAQFTIATKTHFNKLGYQRVLDDMKLSLSALDRQSVDIYYLHSPDGEASLTETLRAVNELHSQGAFGTLAVSNFTAWQTMQIIQLSKENGWLLPKIYQGGYSAIQRGAEREIIPLCRAQGMAFYAYSPLARGLLTAKHSLDKPEESTHPFQEKFWSAQTFSAIEHISDACIAHGVPSVREAALRWLRHHSVLSGAAGDAVVLGASSVEQLQENIGEARGGVLPPQVVTAIEEAHEVLHPIAHFLDMQTVATMKV